MRRETGQWMRRSRSPVRKGRMSASSVPPPGRAPRCWPTRPTGCGSPAREVKVPGVGTVATVSVSWTGQVQANEAKSPNPPDLRRAEPAHAPAVAAGDHGERDGSPVARPPPATCPCAGVVVVHRSPGRCPATSRSPGTTRTSTRQVRLSPSCATWSREPARRGGGVSSVASRTTTRRARRAACRARRGRPAPPTAAATRTTTPIARARPSARVGRQDEVTTCAPRSAGSARCAAGRRRCVRGEISLIHSSGRTTTRCSSTEGATALTSSGVT